MKIRTFFFAAVVGVATLVSCRQTPAVSEARPAMAPYAQLTDGFLGDIEPEGWLKECLERQKDGLTGHPKALSYPFSSCLWAGLITREGPHGDAWWRYEQTAYYTDGLIRLGYELHDTTLIAKGEEGVNYVLDHPTPEGVLGVYFPYMLEGDNYSQWPFAVFFRAIQAMYQATGDERIPAALEKHYLQFAVDKYKSRSSVNIEGVLWTYALTGNPQLLELAEAAWNRGELYLNEECCLSDDNLSNHGVTICEELKLPMILYEYTGKEKYLEEALNAQKKMEDKNILPDGVISSAENLCGQSPVVSHETCDIADYTWTLGYFLMATGESKWADKIEKAVLNAGLGCVTKDFKQLQYFSSVNQFIATGTSNNNDFMKGRTWMAYRPTHQTECCAGNVNRIMPNYVSRMWMKGKAEDSIVAALYGPSKVNFKLSDGTVCTITEKTEYPFGDDIKFTFNFSKDGRRVRSHELSFSFRVPEGCSMEDDYAIDERGFATVSGNFWDGKQLSLHFEAQPVIKETEGGEYVQRGELVFSLPIPAKVEVDTVTYSYMNGKKPDEPGFDCLNMYPEGSWKWALAPDATATFHSGAIARGKYPWECPPVSISIQAYPVKGWDLADGQFTSEAPEKLELDGNEPTTLTLVPYGSTLLRLTVFPTIKNNQ